jgi:hypothetical protein
MKHASSHGSGAIMWPTAQEGVKKSKQLTQRRQDAKKGEVEVVFFFATFAYFAPLRETLFPPGIGPQLRKPWDTASEQFGEPP